MERTRVALFGDRAAAVPVEKRLTVAGIPAEIHEEPGLARFWFVSRPAGGASLEVPAKCAERAAQLILDWDLEEGGLNGAIHCPECGSLRVEFPQVTRKSLSTNLLMGLLAELHLVEREYYCEDCHCMWTRQAAKPHRARRHTAPRYFLE
jgi:hypothetical protein